MMLPILITLMVIGAQALATRPSGDDLPGDCTIADFKRGNILECASKGTYPGSLNGTFGIPVPNENKCTHTGFLQALLNWWKKNAQPIIIEKHLDPLSLPDYDFSFPRKISDITLYGQVAIYDGHIAGLSKFDICGHFVKYGNVVTGIAAAATFPNLEAKYSGEVTFMGLVLQINAVTNIIGSNGNVTFIYNNTSCHFEATDVSLSFGVFNYVISGLGPLDWIHFDLFGALRNLFYKILQPFIANKLKDAMNEALHKLA